ncbi:hypothetical protein Ddc_14302 [Ditylenchus destructor]|nr:hypothetical protein Ddc_14302 [Ditylenchus destructor]
MPSGLVCVYANNRQYRYMAFGPSFGRFGRVLEAGEPKMVRHSRSEAATQQSSVLGQRLKVGSRTGVVIVLAVK